jgi:hypothetical protein
MMLALILGRWVFSSLLSASSKKGHNIYTSSKSSTYKALSGYTWYVNPILYLPNCSGIMGIQKRLFNGKSPYHSFTPSQKPLWPAFSNL